MLIRGYRHAPSPTYLNKGVVTPDCSGGGQPEMVFLSPAIFGENIFNVYKKPRHYSLE
jgi:hypothetical protein